MTTKSCPVCGTANEKLIRTCQLSGVIQRCLGSECPDKRSATSLRRAATPRDEMIMEDGE